MKNRFYVLLLTIVINLIGCGQVQTEAITSSDTTVSTDTSTTPVTGSGTLTVSGTLTFDRIFPKANGAEGLDHNNISKEPMRQVVVKAIDASNSIVATTVTNDNGEYSLTNLPKETKIKVRIYAMMYQQSSSGSWDVRVVDNTNGKSIYVAEGSLVSTGTSNSVRNLHASSGWISSFNDYAYERQSAPFAILDSIYTAMQKVRATDSDVIFPKLTVNWSINNTSSGSGTEEELSDGMIVTSHYNGIDDLYILGDKDGDTDEYDDHIITHEWGHYFEAKFSRADNVGGSHSAGEHLDIRVAFGEGWGNAFSAIATDDPIYFDTMGLNQSEGWYMNIESQTKNVPGWYSEASIQRILYDLYDSNNDGLDRLSLGFTPIYNVLTGAQKNTPAFTSIFPFITALKEENSANSSKINNIVASEDIDTITEIYGEDHYDLYSDMDVGTAHQVCTSSEYGRVNKLNNRKYIRLSINHAGTYTVSVTQNKGHTSDPDFYLFKTQPFEMVAFSQESESGRESASFTLSAGNYLLDVVEYNGLNNACFTVTVN